MNERLVVNVSRFPHETIDGETILIDAETGHLLLLTGFAAVLWSHLVGGTSSEALACAVDARFGADAADITRSFIQELRAAEIIVPTTDVGSAAAAPLPWPECFAAPVFERYDDIANIIAMDPIHDVGPTGWPRPGNNRQA
jgi:Coenzyme PQQ synthesis protein D (PqqD)